LIYNKSNRQIAEIMQFGGFFLSFILRQFKHLFKFSYAFLDSLKISMWRIRFNQW